MGHLAVIRPRGSSEHAACGGWPLQMVPSAVGAVAVSVSRPLHRCHSLRSRCWTGRCAHPAWPLLPIDCTRHYSIASYVTYPTWKPTNAAPLVLLRPLPAAPFCPPLRITPVQQTNKNLLLTTPQTNRTQPLLPPTAAQWPPHRTLLRTASHRPPQQPTCPPAPVCTLRLSALLSPPPPARPRACYPPPTSATTLA